jgi:outer membrane protein assembly factor BamD
MEKVDRDNTQALRAEEECRQMMTAYPNSRYVAQATQMLRNVQEVLAEKEFLAGYFYHHKGAFPAAENRLSFAAQQYPLFSGADEALWLQADSFHHMGDRFEARETAALTRIVRDYPLSDHVEEAKQRLEELKQPVPAADPAAYERQKYELEAIRKPGLFNRSTSLIRRGPETYMAAKTGNPAMTTMRPPTPVSVPAVQNTNTDIPAGAIGSSTNEVTGAVQSDTTAIDSGKNQLQPGAPQAGTPAGSTTPAATEPAKPVTQAPPPTNHPYVPRKKTKKEKKAEEQAAAAAAAKAAAPVTTPVTTPATTPATTGTTPSQTPPQ